VAPLDPHGDVSVAIVTYRSPEVLAECLASFEEHAPRRIGEVIVIDNGAEDGPVDPTRAFPWIDYVRNATNVHFRKGCNQGARLARLPYLLLLNPDAYLTDGEAVARLAGVLDLYPGVGMVGPKIRGDDSRCAPPAEPNPAKPAGPTTPTPLTTHTPYECFARHSDRPLTPRAPAVQTWAGKGRWFRTSTWSDETGPELATA
jgi:GT2 family glycosyltransferase